MTALTKMLLPATLVMGCGWTLFAQTWPLPEDSPAPPAEASNDAPGQKPNVTKCRIDLIDTVELPATEAGVLVLQGSKEGDLVKAEQAIARIDARMPEVEKRVAIYKYNAAFKRAKDDIEIRYSRKASEVAQAKLQQLLDIKSKMEKAITETELREAQLDYERSLLAIDKAINDRKLAELDAYAVRGEVEAASLAIERRTILAPFNGQVVKVYRHEKEWVNPGDPILHLVRMDTLRVNGFVYLSELSPAEVAGCEVTVEVIAAKGRMEKATGRVVSISPMVVRGEKSQKLRITAEIANRTRNGQWILFPNMNGKMTIHLGTGGAAVNARGKQATPATR